LSQIHAGVNSPKTCVSDFSELRATSSTADPLAITAVSADGKNIARSVVSLLAMTFHGFDDRVAATYDTIR